MSPAHHTPLSRKQKLRLVLDVVVFFAVYTIILLLVIHAIPDTRTLIRQVESVYGQYGYNLIFLGALLEGTFMVGFYIPGSFVVLLGAALAKSGVVSFPLVVLFGTLGLTFGYVINYTLGRYGWYRILAGFGMKEHVLEAREKLRHYEAQSLFFGYMMPSTASFLSTAAGTISLPFRQFLLQSLIIQGFWSFLWGGLAFIFGLPFVELFLQYFGIIAALGFFAYLFRHAHKQHRRVDPD